MRVAEPGARLGSVWTTVQDRSGPHVESRSRPQLRDPGNSRIPLPTNKERCSDAEAPLRKLKLLRQKNSACQGGEGIRRNEVRAREFGDVARPPEDGNRRRGSARDAQ